MKKYLLMAATAFLAFSGCQELEDQVKPGESESKDKIELSEEKADFTSKGGEIQVMVTSTADWTLEAGGEYDWVSADPMSGKDGDVVTFKAKSNYTSDKTAEFTFKAGDASVKFPVVSHAGEKPAGPFIELEGEDKITMNHEGGELNILLKSDIQYRDIKVAVTEGTDEWCKHTVNIAGEADKQVKTVFNVSALQGVKDRKTVITFSARGVEPVTVELTQEAERTLSASASEYTILPAGGELQIPILANVAYKIVVPEDATWIKLSKTENDIAFFNVEKLGSGLRQTNIKLVQTDAVAPAQAMECTVTVFQMTALVAYAANMDNARFYIKDAGTAPLTEYTHLTIECLVNAAALDHVRSTIFNFSGKLSLRFGDDGDKNVKKTLPEVYMPEQDRRLAPFWGDGLAENSWHHIAFVFAPGSIKVHFDAQAPVVQSSVTDKVITPFTSWQYDAAQQSGFFLGYGANVAEDFNGMISEVRIWNKALTETDMSAKDHFYNVNPASDGLMLYWKFNGGNTNIIKNVANGSDALKGNDLYGEKNLKSSESGVTGEAGINWVPVKLPEEE